VVVSSNVNNGNAGEPSGNLCLGPSTGAWSPSVAGVRGYNTGIFFRLYMKNPAIQCFFWPEIGSSNKMGTFRYLFNNGKGVPARSPRNDP